MAFTACRSHPYHALMLDHLGIQCADVPTAAVFYDAVLEPLGATRLIVTGHGTHVAGTVGGGT